MGGSVAAKMEVTVTSILAAGKLSNLGDIESTPLIFDITGHFVLEYRILGMKIGSSLFALLASILPGDHKPLISNLCNAHSRLNSLIHRYIRYPFDS
jgi:hypothetical protein